MLPKPQHRTDSRWLSTGVFLDFVGHSFVQHLNSLLTIAYYYQQKNCGQSCLAQSIFSNFYLTVGRWQLLRRVDQKLNSLSSTPPHPATHQQVLMLMWKIILTVILCWKYCLERAQRDRMWQLQQTLFEKYRVERPPENLEYHPKYLGDIPIKIANLPKFSLQYFTSPAKFSKSPDSYQNLQIFRRMLFFSQNRPSRSWQTLSEGLSDRDNDKAETQFDIHQLQLSIFIIADTFETLFCVRNSESL